MEQRAKANLYRAILIFALADVAFGVASLFCDIFALQISALSVTTITLILSITFTIKYPRNKRSDIATIVIGGMDFVTTLISVLVIVMATQVIAIVASGFTFFKAVKIFIQSEKAMRLLDSTKAVVIKIARRLAPAVGAWLMSKAKKIKTQIEGEDHMEKLKEFFVKLGQNIRANKVCLAETVVNGGAWGLVAYLLSTIDSVTLEVAGVNVLPYFTIIVFVLIELGLQWEKFGDFMARISPKLAKKLEARKQRELQKEQAAAAKERERLLAEMRAEKAAEEKAILEAKERAAKEEKEAKERAAKEAEDRELAEWLAKKQAQ